jgi:hypothetical protein
MNKGRVIIVAWKARPTCIFGTILLAICSASVPKSRSSQQFFLPSMFVLGINAKIQKRQY